jgi:hypothetical protein
MRPFVIAIACCILVGGAAAQQCSTIFAVDFRNSNIRTSADGDLRFRPGVFESRDPSGIAQWRWEIRRDVTVTPLPDTKIRMLEILGDHLSGTGSRTYLIGFRCADGAIKQAFQEEGEGMRVMSLSSEKVTLKFGVWKRSDPHCCPSGEKTVQFIWDSAKQTYVSTSQVPAEVVDE